MAIDLLSLGRTLAEIRRLRGLSQREIGERTGLTVNFISLVENGERGLSNDALNNYASALGLDAELIVFLAGNGQSANAQLAKLSKSLKAAILESIAVEKMGSK